MDKLFGNRFLSEYIMNENELVVEREMFPYLDESICCMVLRVLIMQGILARVFTSESLWFSSLTV